MSMDRERENYVYEIWDRTGKGRTLSLLGNLRYECWRGKRRNTYNISTKVALPQDVILELAENGCWVYKQKAPETWDYIGPRPKPQ